MRAHLRLPLASSAALLLLQGWMPPLPAAKVRRRRLHVAWPTPRARQACTRGRTHPVSSTHSPLRVHTPRPDSPWPQPAIARITPASPSACMAACCAPARPRQVREGAGVPRVRRWRQQRARGARRLGSSPPPQRAGRACRARHSTLPPWEQRPGKIVQQQQQERWRPHRVATGKPQRMTSRGRGRVRGGGAEPGRAELGSREG